MNLTKKKCYGMGGHEGGVGSITFAQVGIFLANMVIIT